MNIKRIVFASLFCIAVLLCAGKKAEAAFPYDMEQKPVTATSIHRMEKLQFIVMRI